LDNQQAILRIGQILRRAPVARHALDLRVALIQRRRRRAAERREQLFADRDRQTLAACRGRTDLKINVGSSMGHVHGWINADLGRDPEGHTFRMDATAPWPFEDGAAEAVNSEHFIEHIDRGAAPAYFAEAFRVLRPGGVLRTSTPSLRALVDAYLEQDPALLDAHRQDGYVARTHADMLNNYVHMSGEHVYIYDEETLTLLLEEAGFARIEEAAFGDSRHAALVGVDRHPMGELQGLVICLDAVRP
jgi:predicted SAM-dependent methyltransferase